MGPRAGILTVTSDAADAPFYDIDLFATILDHSVASLDSSVIANGADSLAFDGESGTLADRDLRIHNFGWDANQARLQVQEPSITGSPLFTVVDGGDALLAGVGRTYTVRFDEGGAVPDVVYTGEMRIASADESLPGAETHADLVIALRGIVRSPSVSTPDQPLPSVTRLLAPAPNPLSGAASLRFDLARAGRVRLDVLDLAGRRVATPVDRSFEPGRHALSWRAVRDGGAPLGPGVYFLRMTGDERRTVVRFAVVK